jgi:hypothetical protein
MTQCKEPVIGLVIKIRLHNSLYPRSLKPPGFPKQCRWQGNRFINRHQPPGVNYMNAPTNIAPITQGYQPVGMPTFLGGTGMPQQTRSFLSQTTNLGSPAYTQPNRLGVKHAYVCTRAVRIPGPYRKRLMKAPQKSLKDWTQQKWRTKSGKPSTQGPKATGERYLPEAAIKSLSSAEYAASTRAKRAGKAAGKQFVAQPKRIAQKTARHRKRLIG